MRKRIIVESLGIKLPKVILDKYEFTKLEDNEKYDARNWYRFKCKKCRYAETYVIYYDELSIHKENELKLHYYQFHKSRSNMVCHETAPTQIIENDYKGMYSWERNDCVLRTCSIAFELPYPDVHKMFKEAGRKNKTGTKVYIYDSFYKKGLGKYRTEYTTLEGYKKKSKLKLKDFLELHKTGRYIISTRGHQLCVIDGVCMDTFENKLNKKIVHYYKLIEV